MADQLRGRGGDLAAAVAIALAGLAWRMAPLGLPTFWLRSGGSALWGAMVFMLVAACSRRTTSRWTLAGLAGLIAVASEFFRLVHAPSLDAFRLTLPGALLLGRVFSLSNIVAYAVGIAAALSLHLAASGGRAAVEDINLKLR